MNLLCSKCLFLFSHLDALVQLEDHPLKVELLVRSLLVKENLLMSERLDCSMVDLEGFRLKSET